MAASNLTYVKGCFCFEDKTIYNEEDTKLYEHFSEFLFNYLYGDEQGSFDVDVVIPVAHELLHLTQDLSLTSSYVEQHLVDQITMLSSLRPEMLSSKEPLFLATQDYCINPCYFNQSSVDPVAVLAYTLLSFYSKLFLHKEIIPYTGRILSGWTGMDMKDMSISYNDLLESQAHFQSLKSVFDRVLLNKMSQIKPHQSPSKYFPLKCSSDGALSVDAKQIKYNGRYFNPFIYYFLSTSKSIWWGDIVNYFNTRFPCPSDINPGVNVEVANCLTFYNMVIEVSLTIPSYGYMVDCQTSYNPVHRFAYVMSFVSGLTRDDIYRYSTGRIELFFNDCAKKFNWLNYEETIKTFTFDKGGDFLGVCISDAISFRREHDYYAINAHLFVPKIPLLLRNDSFFKVSYIGEQVFFADCPYRSIDDAFFREYKEWENTKLDPLEMMEFQGQTLKNIGSILCKRAVAKSFITGNTLSCPLKSIECPLRNESCDSISDITLLRRQIGYICKSKGRENKSCVLLSIIDAKKQLQE